MRRSIRSGNGQLDGHVSDDEIEAEAERVSRTRVAFDADELASMTAIGLYHTISERTEAVDQVRQSVIKLACFIEQCRAARAERAA